MNERDRIVASMTRAELWLYAALGGELSTALRARLESGEPERVEWYAPRRIVLPALPTPAGPARPVGRHYQPPPGDGPAVEGVDKLGRVKRWRTLGLAARALHVAPERILAAARDGTTVVRRLRWRLVRSAAA